MPLPEDSRTFTVLRQHVADFKSGLDDDINSCLDLLENKLSGLIQDPGTANAAPKDGSRLSVDIQFSRAKYDIYVNMKSLFEEFESSWREQLEEMKNSFLENVEILLAKTKLDDGKLQNDNKKTRKVQNEASKVSTISPYSLIVKAKKLPSSMLSSFLPQSNETDEDIDENGYTMNDGASKKSSRCLFQSSKVPVKRTPSPKKIQSQTTEDIIDNTMDQDYGNNEEAEIVIQEVVTARQKRNRAKITSPAKPTPTKHKTAVQTPQKRSARGRKSILKPDSLIESELHTTPSRSTRKRTAGKDTNLGASDIIAMEYDENDLEAAPKTPKNVHFSVGLNADDDLEIYSPEINLTRSAPRRKTVMVEVAENHSEISITPDIVRTKSKRKTIGSSVMESVSIAPSPKRFKSSRNSSIAPIAEQEEDVSKSEPYDAGHYTPWVLLDDLDGKVPTQPGVYELKVYKAKKSAYIGSCENLRHKLTLHKLSQNSGHKHLDKYLERNKKEVQVRYEIISSAAQAKNEGMKRIKLFVKQFGTTPSYN